MKAANKRLRGISAACARPPPHYSPAKTGVSLHSHVGSARKTEDNRWQPKKSMSWNISVQKNADRVVNCDSSVSRLVPSVQTQNMQKNPTEN